MRQSLHITFLFRTAFNSFSANILSVTEKGGSLLIYGKDNQRFTMKKIHQQNDAILKNLKGQEILFLRENKIINAGGQELGYFDDQVLYNRNGQKIAYFKESQIWNTHGQVIGFVEESFVLNVNKEKIMTIIGKNEEDRIKIGTSFFFFVQ